MLKNCISMVKVTFYTDIFDSMQIKECIIVRYIILFFCEHIWAENIYLK